MRKLVLTGAAGKLGSRLRAPLAKLAEELVSTDLADGVDGLAENERFQRADLSQLDEVEALMEGAEMVVHFGAIGDEAPFDDILRSNIIGTYNVYEAAYRAGVRRVVYASSIHAVGMYPKTQAITVDTPHKPDTFYGLSKCFGEDLASLYWDRRQLESVCLRIYSCNDVGNTRALGSWLSYGDLVRLVERAIDTPTTGCAVIYGVSDNDRAPVDNSGARFLGYRPQDNAEQYAAELLGRTPAPEVGDPGEWFHGGPFAKIELGQSGLAAMKKAQGEG